LDSEDKDDIDGGDSEEEERKTLERIMEGEKYLD
jgi:hypothetical protein